MVDNWRLTLYLIQVKFVCVLNFMACPSVLESPIIMSANQRVLLYSLSRDGTDRPLD